MKKHSLLPLVLLGASLPAADAHAVLADNISSDKVIDIYTDHDETGNEGVVIWAGQNGIYGDDSPSQYKLAEFGTGGTSGIYTPLSVTGNTALSNQLNVSGKTTLNGLLDVNAGIEGENFNVANDTGNTAIGGTLGVSGATTLSNHFTLDTNGASAGGSRVTADATTLTMQSGGDATIVKGGTNSGTWTLDDGDAAGGTNLTISGSAGGTAATVFQTTTDSATTTVSTRVGTSNDTYTSTVSLQAGSNNAVTVDSSGVSAQGENSTLSLADGAAALSSGNAGGYRTFASDTQAVSGAAAGGQYQLIYGDADTKSLVEGSIVRNVIVGNTLVDGSLFVNGPVVQSSSTAVTTVVTSPNGSKGGSSAAIAGQNNYVVDNNGKIQAGTVTETTAALTVTNQSGNVHGFHVDESSATMSGGVNSTSLTLNDAGATFSNAATGAPVRVRGVADGKDDFDAVNVRQLKKAYSGIAGVAALTQLPEPMPNKRYSFGVGLGHYQNESALALGLKARYKDNTTLSIGLSHDSQDKNVVAAGIGWSW